MKPPIQCHDRTQDKLGCLNLCDQPAPPYLPSGVKSCMLVHRNHGMNCLYVHACMVANHLVSCSAPIHSLLRHLNATFTQIVVVVHQAMHDRVDSHSHPQWHQKPPFEGHPSAQRDSCMMEHMEENQILLLQNQQDLRDGCHW